MRVLRQLIVVFQGMRLHRPVACLHVRRQAQGDRRRLLAFLAAAFQSQAHGIGVRHVAGEGLADGGVEFARPILLQQADQGGGNGAEIVAALGGADQQDLAGRRA
jgi:hypothetical protein